MSDDVRIEEAVEVSDELAAAFARLTPQLSSSAPTPSRDELEEITASLATRLLVAHQGTRILGTLTLVVFRIPTGMRAIIEDVVVDEQARGLGLGKKLTVAALKVACGAGCKTVDLTSRPSRVAANQLYQKLGFEPRETNVYRYTL